MGKEPEPFTRKSVSLPDDLWAEVSEYRFSRRIGTEAEALRQLIQAGLKAERERAGSGERPPAPR